ncbi:hypothetical protein [Denitrobaculum tricleocarpae]|uniref:Uncharacterized protein n=1 Tax=Denitrobaculum tricleocarpae TaxID=2591009 RepID=A0A545TYE8_9PROT|nr:hypothetical protein [Denitrobaculum tricleocarpae]TQV82221.1 hypothetical protein FKG95_08360 [Denitrobaculum tricleocarpae]
MALSKTVEKLDKYYGRLKSGSAKKIKPAHVEKMIDKLKARERDLKDEISTTEKESKRERLERKLLKTRDLTAKAKWLLKEIG